MCLGNYDGLVHVQPVMCCYAAWKSHPAYHKASVKYLTLERIFELCPSKIYKKSDCGFKNTTTLPQMLSADKVLPTMQRVTADRKVVYDLVSHNVSPETAISQVLSSHGLWRRTLIKGPKL